MRKRTIARNAQAWEARLAIKSDPLGACSAQAWERARTLALRAAFRYFDRRDFGIKILYINRLVLNPFAPRQRGDAFAKHFAFAKAIVSKTDGV
jgi:hypothetical protein